MPVQSGSAIMPATTEAKESHRRLGSRGTRTTWTLREETAMNYPLMLLLAFATACVGCGAGDDEPAGDLAAREDAEPIEPWDESAFAGCELVTDDEIMSAVGEPVSSKEEGGYYGCRWKTESHLLNLSIFSTTSLPPDACQEGGTSMPYGKSAQGKQYPVSGLGDSAIWGSSGDLLVCTGRGLLTVDYESSPAAMSPDDEKEVAVKVAQYALGRL